MAATEKLRSNLERIDQALPILFRCVVRYDRDLSEHIPDEEVITDEHWEGFIAFAAEEWRTYIDKFAETPLNGLCRQLMSDCYKINVEKMKKKYSR